MRRPSRPAVITVLTALALTACSSGTPAPGDAVTLTIASNSISGGKNGENADWIAKWVIPEFEKAQKAKGRTVKVVFQPSGVDDEQYKTRIALDLKSKKGADVLAVDGIWVGEFAQAGYLRPLTDVAGTGVESWEGWAQIPQAVQGLGIFEGKKYGIPLGTDGRVLFYNKDLFKKAGLGEPWQPKSWQEILDAGAALKKLPGVTPLQINAGAAMGEATTMQGALPLLVGAGAEIYADGKWAGAGTAMKDMLGFYRQVYGGGLGDPLLQQEAKGRDKSFAEFADNKIGILLESDYFWRSVVEPNKGVAKMADRNTAVGWAMVPARTSGAGVGGQDFVSMSGGAVRVLNPFTKQPALTWELLSFMHSAAATKSELAGQVRISARKDVNDEVLTADPMLKFIADEVLPITAYRPPLAVYPQVSTALQTATSQVVAGTAADEAATTYQHTLEGLVGGPANISG